MNLSFNMGNSATKILAFIFLSLLIGWGINIFIAAYSLKKVILLLMLVVCAIIGVILFKWYAKKYSLYASFLQITLLTSFIGSGLISINVGPFSLFPVRIFIVIMFFMTIYYLFTIKKDELESQFHIPYTLLFFIFWFTYACLSFLWIKSIGSGLTDIILLLTGILPIFYVIFYFHHEKQYIDFFYIWIIMYGFLILIGFWNHFTLNQLPISRLYNGPAYEKGIPTAVFTNENDYASFLALSVFFALAMIHYVKKFYIKLLGIFLIVSSLFLIIVASSRANLLAIILGLAFWFIFLIKRNEKIRILLSGIIIVPMVTLVFYQKVTAVFGKAFNEIASLHDTSTQLDSTNVRINLLRNVVHFFTDSFGFGVGVGNAEYYMGHFAIFDTGHDVNVHNWWAEILVNYGLVIFALYICMYVFLIVKLVNVFHKLSDNRMRMICEALICALVTFSLASISPSSMFGLKYNWILFAFAIGFLNFTIKKYPFLRRTKKE